MLTKNWCIDFLKVNKFDLAEARRLCNICGLGNPSLECECLLPLKSTTLAMYRTQKPTQKLKYCFLSAHAQSDKLCKARKLFSSNEKKKSSKTKPKKLTRMQIGLYESGWRGSELNDFEVGNDIKTVREQKKVPLDQTLENE